MALNDDGNNMVMPVAPMYGGGYGNNGGFGWGGDWAWILILLLCGWNNGFGGFGGMGGYGNMMLGYDFPWLLNGQNGINANTNAGFAQAATQSALGDLSNAVTGGFADVNLGIAGVNQNICQSTGQIQNALCQGFAGTTAAVTAAQNGITQQMYNNEIADLNRSFAAQTATSQGLNNIQSQLAQCCCDNRAATQDVKYTIATEACANRATSTANTQAILDKLCQLELDNAKTQIDAKNDIIAQLRQEVLYARGQASQGDQTARIIAGQNAEVDALYNRLNNCPVPSTPVYGRIPIFNCNNNGCACGAV